MKTSRNGVNFIMKEEGCKLKAYKLAGEKYYTIGVGHYGPDVKEGQTITKSEAEEILKSDLKCYETAVEKNVKNIQMTQNMFDALVSYTFNRGEGGLRQLAANSNTVEQYANNIVTFWGRAERYKNELIERRKREKALFLTGYRKTQHIQLNYKAGNAYKTLVTLNIRDKPSTAGKKIGTIVSGTKVVNRATTRAGEAIWMYIGLDGNGREKWICADTGEKMYVK
ncbi:MAG: glycoside hydrolase family protein [Bariatricus sp.]